ncbi:MAG: photosystem II S4 domain protein [Pseudanabaenaceae cyanobacterium]
MPAESLFLAHIQDLSDRALKTWEVCYTQFLAPPELVQAVQLLERLTEIHCLGWGGYAQAERQILAIARPELEITPSQFPILPLQIMGNFLFDPAHHRDFLGAILSTGIERDQVGDIIVLGERGAQVIVASHLADYLTTQLTQVRTVPVTTQPIPWSDLSIRLPQQKEVITTEASLRLDAVASAGFGISRSKMVELIMGDEVRVNWQSVTSPSYQLKSGDLVSLRGKGRLTIGDITITKKQRYRIQMLRST